MTTSSQTPQSHGRNRFERALLTNGCPWRPGMNQDLPQQRLDRPRIGFAPGGGALTSSLPCNLWAETPYGFIGDYASPQKTYVGQKPGVPRSAKLLLRPTRPCFEYFVPRPHARICITSFDGGKRACGDVACAAPLEGAHQATGSCPDGPTNDKTRPNDFYESYGFNGSKPRM